MHHSWGYSSVMVVALGLACGPGDTGESAGSSTGGEASSEGASSGSSGATAGSETTTTTGPMGTSTSG
ncbi:MAG TPA: FMN-binding protein, partial [Nannocystis exedens]|nr:FMN-binding protein [Nannocystis exedens]